MEPTSFSEKTLTRTLLDVLIRAGLIAVLVLFCFEIFSPFLDLMLWSLILAITLYPLQGRLKGLLGHKDGRIATLIVVIAIVILVVPIYCLGTSIADSVDVSMEVVKSGSFTCHHPPNPSPVGHWWASRCMACGCRPQPTFPT